MLVLSKQTVSSVYSNTPSIQALLMDAPQFTTYATWLVILKPDILQNAGQTVSLSLTPLQDSKRRTIT
jgi:hypothetical protein